jgi:hypothetical protein
MRCGSPMPLLLRLDEMQSVAINNLAHTPFSLVPEVSGILKSQAAFFVSGNRGEEYLGYRELLKQD